MVKSSRTKSQRLRRIEAGPDANQPVLQMCPIHRYFKHFHGPETKDFRLRRKVPSIM
jgi:hypothetical protein